MKYYKRLGIFKTSKGRGTLNPTTMTARSYDWWQFVAVIDGKVYFNWFHYSMATGYHQRAVRQTLRQLGVKFENVSVRAGLQNISGEVPKLEYDIKVLQEAIDKPRSRKATNETRRKQIAALREEIKLMKRLARGKRGDYKGRLNWKAYWDAQPEPVPLTEDQKRIRLERKQKREAHRTEYLQARDRENERLSVRATFQLIHGGKQ